MPGDHPFPSPKVGGPVVVEVRRTGDIGNVLAPLLDAPSALTPESAAGFSAVAPVAGITYNSLAKEPSMRA